jgi:hypothetical protein
VHARLRGNHRGALHGPAWLAARSRGRPAHGLAVAYRAVVGGVAVSAGILAVTDPELTWLLPVAVVTEVLAVTGAPARRHGWAGGGAVTAPARWSYIALAERRLHTADAPLAPATA